MAKQIKSTKNIQTRKQRQLELHTCHSPEEIVGALQDILRDHDGWKGLLVKSLKDAHENARKNLSKEYYKRFMLHSANTLDEYYAYLKWFVNWKPHEYNKGYDNKVKSGEAFNKEVFFSSLNSIGCWTSPRVENSRIKKIRTGKVPEMPLRIGWCILQTTGDIFLIHRNQ